MLAAPKGGSKDRLLDAAEMLFARYGYDAASTRDIASQAGDTLGTLSYYFGSKERLLAEVVKRRWDDMGEARRRMYNEYALARADGKPELDEVIRCIVLPHVDKAMRGGEAWASYTTLLGRMVYVGSQVQYAAVAELTDAQARIHISWLQDALPEASPIDVGYGYEFTISCLIGSVSRGEHDRLKRITDGACNPDVFDEVVDRLLAFIQAGFRRVLEVSGSGPPRVSLRSPGAPITTHRRSRPLASSPRKLHVSSPESSKS